MVHDSLFCIALSVVIAFPSIATAIVVTLSHTSRKNQAKTSFCHYERDRREHSREEAKNYYKKSSKELLQKKAKISKREKSTITIAIS